MKKTLIVSIIVIALTLYVNLNFIWNDGNSGLTEFGFFFIGIFLFLHLAFAQIIIALGLKNKFNAKKAILLFVNIICLILICIYPTGIYHPSEKRTPYLIAFNEGVANCSTTLVLFKNLDFKEVNVCFGTTTTIGTYKIHNDTIKFNVESLGKGEKFFYEYAVINKNKTKLSRYYKNNSLKRGNLYISKIKVD